MFDHRWLTPDHAALRRKSRPNLPTLKSPSRVVPHSPQCSRVTLSSCWQTGQVAMTS